MKNSLLLGLTALSIAGCAYRGTVLAPPTPQTQIGQDVRACFSEAAAPRVLSAPERALIAGKDTARFFMNGRPVVNPDGVPALHQSVLPQTSNEQADRYAVCLLSRGYKWQAIQ